MKFARRRFNAASLSVALSFAATVGMACVLSTGALADKKPRGALQHHQVDAHGLLGALLHVDGVHKLGGGGPLGNLTGSLGSAVAANVKNGKVVDMTDAGKPLTKVKSKKKMAELESGFIKASYVQLAQYDSGYDSYGYCEDDGYQETCYWYEPSDVDQSGDWQDYSTYENSY